MTEVISKPALRAHVRQAVDEIFARNLYGSASPPPLGHLRGIDVLDRQTCVQKLSRAAQILMGERGRLINLTAPTGFFEKIVIAKFFAPVPMPSPADKLGVGRFIPDDLRKDVRTIPTLWTGQEPIGPKVMDPLNLKDGRYFAKSNCGSGTNFGFSVPTSPEDADKLATLSDLWLNESHGERAGEWWYGLIRPQVFIEPDMAPGSSSLTDWKFHTGGGRVLAVQVDRDRYQDHAQLMYDRDFTYLPERMFFKTGTPDPKPAHYAHMRKVAETIGAQFEYARVDLYWAGEQIYLGEITLAPIGGQRPPSSDRLDAFMGAAWTGGIFGT